MGALTSMRQRIGGLFSGLGRSIGGGRAEPMGFDAGRMVRTDPDFIPSAMGPNLRNHRYLKLAWRRMASMIDDVPQLNGARELLRRNIVGGDLGIWPQPNTGDRELDKLISEVWWAQHEAVDAGREETAAQSQGAYFNQLFVFGEAMANVPVVSPFRGYARGPAIELIDSSARVDLYLCGKHGNNRVSQGVEFDAEGRRVAYHVYSDDPNDSDGLSMSLGVPTLGGRGMTRLPAEQATLGFVPRWTNQIRGVPWAVSIVTTVRLEESFKEAEILLAKARASVGVWMEGATGPVTKLRGGGDNANCARDSHGNTLHRIEPGMIGYPAVGAKPNTLSITTPGATLMPVVEMLQRLEAVGLGMGYGAFSRDRSKSTFSADRSDVLEDRKGYRETQALIWHKHTRPFYEALVTWAVMSGKLKLNESQRTLFEQNPRKFLNVTVIAPGWEWVNPYQEAQADEVALRNGVKSKARFSANLGKDWRDVTDSILDEEEYEIAERKRRGLPPKVDPAAKPVAPVAPKDAPLDEDGNPKEDTDDKPAKPGEQTGEAA